MTDQLRQVLTDLRSTFTETNQKLIDLSAEIKLHIAQSIANWTSDSRCPLRMTEDCPRMRALLAGEKDLPVCVDCPHRRNNA